MTRVGRVKAVLSANVGLAETVLAVFLMAGSFKAQPWLQWLPVDLTLLGALATALLVGIAFARDRFTIPLGILPILPFFLLILPTLTWMEWHPYGTDKTIRLYSITLLAMLAPPFLVTTTVQVRRFLNALAAVGIFLTIDALLAFNSTSSVFARTGEIAGPVSTIVIGSTASLAFLWLVLLFLARQLPLLLAGIGMAGLAVVVLGSGSRGPLLVTVVVLGFIFLAFPQARSTQLIKFGALVVVLAGILGAVSPLLPAESLERVERFINGDFGGI